jgi:hypothetical protein
MTLKDGLQRDIKILEKELKEEAELKKILKLRLTKKEYKVFLMINQNSNDDLMKEKLLLDDKRLEEVKISLIKKLNYEKLKHELTQG